MFRRQLPVVSPIRGSALLRLPAELAAGHDRRDNLAAALRTRLGATGCVLTGSGTNALQMALATVRDRSPGLPVLIPAYSCYEVATAVVATGLPVRLYDLDPQTLEPDWQSVKAAGMRGAAALVIAPLYGLPLDWAAARAAAEELGAVMIEDAAQGHGSAWRGMPVGSFGDLSVLSFGRGKGWTGGAGGALLWRGVPAPAALPTETPRESASLLRAGAQWLLARPALFGIPASIPILNIGQTIYHPPARIRAMSRVAAALITSTEKAAGEEVLRRRHNAGWYTDVLAADRVAPDTLIGARLNDESGALRYPVRTQEGWASIWRTSGVSLGIAPPYPMTLQKLPALQQLLDHSPVTPGADLIVRQLVTLPTHSLLREDERQRIVRLLLPMLIRA